MLKLRKLMRIIFIIFNMRPILIVHMSKKHFNRTQWLVFKLNLRYRVIIIYAYLFYKYASRIEFPQCA